MHAGPSLQGPQVQPAVTGTSAVMAHSLRERGASEAGGWSGFWGEVPAG